MKPRDLLERKIKPLLDELVNPSPSEIKDLLERNNFTVTDSNEFFCVKNDDLVPQGEFFLLKDRSIVSDYRGLELEKNLTDEEKETITQTFRSLGETLQNQVRPPAVNDLVSKIIGSSSSRIHDSLRVASSMPVLVSKYSNYQDNNTSSFENNRYLSKKSTPSVIDGVRALHEKNMSNNTPYLDETLKGVENANSIINGVKILFNELSDDIKKQLNENNKRSTVKANVSLILAVLSIALTIIFYIV